MAKKYANIKSKEAGNEWLLAIEKRIITLRLEQSSSRNRLDWYRTEETLNDLYHERSTVRQKITQLEGKERLKYGATFR